jgi:6-phosphofructokinase 1
MGRNTGWIALKAGIAGGADIILIPEIPYDINTILEKINTRSQRGAKFSIIVVAEGAKPLGGQPIFQEWRDLGEVRRLGGIGQFLANQLREVSNANVRVTVLGHLQRGGSPSAFDRLLASRFGTMVVHFIAEGKIGYMVAYQDDEIKSISIEEAVSQQKLVPLNSDIVLTALGLDICLGEQLSNIKKSTL